MEGLEEIAVIHSVDDYPVGLFIKESLKLEGFSYFTYAYNERNDQINDILKNSDNRFDLILYVNDQNGKFREKFGHLSRYNINVEISNEQIWTLPGKLDSKSIEKVWGKVIEELFVRQQDADDLRKIMRKIGEVYCKYDLFRKLLNNTESWFEQVKEEKSETIYRKQLEKQCEIWSKALEELEQYSEEIIGDRTLLGQEHLDYAILYCKRKINDICNLLGERFEYDSWELIIECNKMHTKYEADFYMAENIIAQNAKMSLEYKGMAFSAMKDCIRQCRVPACNSFHFYRLGKIYEKAEKVIQAEFAYENAYRINPLNFRALYKNAVNSRERKYYDIARKEFERILELLQVLTEDIERFLETVTKLPALELEYICKCYVLLADLEEREEHIDYRYYNSCAKVINLIVEMVRDDKNIFLKKMYGDQPEYKKYLEQRLSLNAIKEKVNI